MSDIKARRTALGWTRAELCKRGNIDPRTMQLIELGQSEDEESRQRALAALDAEEKARGGTAGGDNGAS